MSQKLGVIENVGKEDGQKKRFIALAIDLRDVKGGQLKDALRVMPDDWDAKVAEWKKAMDDADADEKTEVQITTANGIQAITFAQLQQHCCY